MNIANSRGDPLFVKGCLAWSMMEGTQYSQWLLLLRCSQGKVAGNLTATVVAFGSPISHSELKVL